MAQKPILPPQAGPAMEWKDRYDLTKQHLATHIRPLPAPPAGFNPLKATNEELLKAGLPQSPDPKTQPAAYAKWKAVMGKPLTHVSSTFTPSASPRDSLPKNLGVTPSNGYSSGNWSGAVAQSLAAGDSYKWVSGSWTVPNAYPPASANNKDGTYWCSSWVGLDGWGSPDVLQAGTDTFCTVSGGKITAQAAIAWQEWYPFVPVVFNNFPVKPGDNINCLVCASSGAGSTTGTVYLHNTSTGNYTNAQLTAPAGTKLAATCAEWILEDPGAPSVPFPDYGAEFFYDCSAGTVKGVQENLSSATPINLVQNGQTLSTAVVENSTVLMTYYPGSGP